jgi:two-component system, NarL family, response regulator NreC
VSEPTRVALCDDHAVVRSGLRRILELEDGFEVVGEAGTAGEAIAIVRAERPDVFVMDVGLPGADGIDVARRIVEINPGTAVLVLTVHDDVGYLRKAFGAGAKGYLLKDAADTELVQAIRQVSGGGRYVHPSLGAALLAEPATHSRPNGPGGELSDREEEVLRCVALGLTNAETASKLFVSIRTVESHRAHIQQKLGVQGRAKLVQLAREQGLLDDEEPAS